MNPRRLSPIFALFALTVATSQAGAASIYGKVYDTMRGKMYPNTRLVLVSEPAYETTTDAGGQYGFRDVKPGAYLIRILRGDGEGEVVGRLVVSPNLATTIVNLDLSRIEAPHHDDEH